MRSRRMRGITFRQLIGNTSGYMKPGEPPGKVFNYQSWGMGALTHAVASAYSLYKTSDPERGSGFGTLTEWKLRRPIGGSWTWRYHNPQVHAEANLPVFGYITTYYMKPRDMARVGLLWQRGGEWRGVPVIPRAWLEEATRVSSEILQNEPERAPRVRLGLLVQRYRRPLAIASRGLLRSERRGQAPHLGLSQPRPGGRPEPRYLSSVRGVRFA